MPTQSDTDLRAAIRELASTVAAGHADDVDRQARFPHETVQALRAAGALGAGVPRELGGGGLGLRELGALCAALGRGCGSSAMVLAMHSIQVACLVRHGISSDFFRAYLREVAEKQLLLASMTSEVGTSGEMRTSICAVERQDGRWTLEKNATTGSYCAHADAILVTCRRAPDATANDQVLVLARAGDAELTQTGSWDTLGMRGTCSPGFVLRAAGADEQIVPGAFAECAAQTMVPWSHVLWSALWEGIAADAVARAAAFVRAGAKGGGDGASPAALRLARVSARLQALRHHWTSVAREVDELDRRDGGARELLSMAWALRLNHLKVESSEAAPAIVHEALQIIGVAGYRNDSPYSVGRHYRDVLSAALMVSNDRIAAKSAALLRVVKDG